MDIKRFLSWFTFILGIVIIVASFLFWKGNSSDDIFVLNLVVSLIIYCLIFVDIFVPWVNLNDCAQRQVGSMGVWWTISGIYVLAAIGVMVVCNLMYSSSFKLQLLIHCSLLFCLLLGFVGVLHSSNKVDSVYKSEQVAKKNLQDMRQAVSTMIDAMVACSLPQEVVEQMKNLEEGVRYISPSNNPDAHLLERQFVEIIQEITMVLNDYSMNQEKVWSDLKKAERVCQSRKMIYSN